jgi:hypothetical protein
MTQENKLTPGELLELVRGLKELGVCKGKIEGLEFEFAPDAAGRRQHAIPHP